MKKGIEYLNSPTKRRLDLLGATAILPLLLPAGAIAGVVSQIDNRTLNPIFKQERIGKNGKTFEVYKLRTLSKDATDGEVQTYGTYDPRASRVGMVMREAGVDEWPQVINVLSGEMSLVGIRPLINQDIERLEDLAPDLYQKWYEVYEQSKPGLTGPSQILRHKYKVTTDEVWRKSVELDLNYTANASLKNDLKILGATPLRLLNARIHMVDNSYEADSTLASDIVH